MTVYCETIGSKCMLSGIASGRIAVPGRSRPGSNTARQVERLTLLGDASGAQKH